MKCILVFLLVVIIISSTTNVTSGQNISINNDGSKPDPNAILDVKASDKGILIPRTSTASRSAIPNTKGLLVYDTTTNSFWYNDGSTWNNISGTISGWSLSGNSGTDTSKNFLGTTDTIPLAIRVNNFLSGVIGNKYPFNTGWGYQSLNANTTGSYNTANGYDALNSNTTGYTNTANGAFALYRNTTGISNTAIGDVTLFSNTIGNNNTAIGALSIEDNTGGFNNTATGTASMQYNTTGAYNTSVGAYSLNANTTGSSNAAMGEKSMMNNTIGTYNATLGSGALFSNTGGSSNVAVGFQSLYFNTGNLNTAIGCKAMYNYVSGSANTALGFDALYGQDIYDPATTPNSGSNNTGIGYEALYGTGISNNNTAVGYQALEESAGDYNTAIGFRASYSSETFNSTAIGANAGCTATNSTAIGANAVAGYINTIQLGDGNITDVLTNTNCVIHAKSFLQYSDATLKYAVQPMKLGLNFIQLLQPVTYFFKNDTSKRLYTGFIAQDVEKAAQQLGAVFSGVYKPKDGKDYYALSYQDFIMPLVKSVQELSAQNDLLRKQFNDLLKKVTMLEDKMAR